MLYPLLVTFIGQTAFPHQANGSLIVQGDKAVGSALIGQSFTDPKYFWGRPSATGPYPYNAAASSGSNQGPLNPALADAVKARIQALRDADPGNTAPVPVDLVTASASGLDPQISPAAAEYQIDRVAQARHMEVQAVRDLVASTLKVASSVCSASRASMSWNSIWHSMRCADYSECKHGTRTVSDNRPLIGIRFTYTCHHDRSTS